MNKKHSSYYRIGLDPKTHFRSRIIFSLMSLLLIFFTTYGLYAGIKSGKINQVLVQPVKDLVHDLTTISQTPELTPPETFFEYSATSSAEINIEVKTNTNQKSPTKSNQYTTPAYFYPTPAISNSTDEWWNKVQEENRLKSEQSQKSLEQFRQQSQQNLEQFKQESKQGFEDFVKEGKQQQEEFRQKYGF